ncbi:MAG: M28 family metallopeptidase [Chloroflexota bacterium]
MSRIIRRALRPGLLFAALGLLLLAASGCSLLEEPARPVIPTPRPTPQSLEEVLAASGDVVVDPARGTIPSVEPECSTLVNAVSQQQLMAYVQTLESFGTRNTFSETQRDDFGIGAARRWIFSEFERVGNGRLEVSFQDYSFAFQGVNTTQRNVIATLPGISDHAGTIVLMANYDTRVGDWMDGTSRAPGADDNASGIANLLEIARLLSSRNWNQTIIFAALTAEEQGTYGSRHFVQDAVLDGMMIDAAINNDMIGGRGGIPQYVRLFAEGPDTSGNRQLARYIEFIGGLYLPTFRIEVINALDREDRWGDQREFVYAGIPAVRLIESEEDLSIQNSARDTWDLIDYSYFAQIVQLNLAVLCNMIGAPPPPPAPLVAPMADPGAFILSWQAEPEAGGYAVSFRPLNSDDYPPFRFVSPNQTGNVVLTGLDPETTYAVSIAAIGTDGRLGAFSPEIIVGPEGT